MYFLVHLGCRCTLWWYSGLISLVFGWKKSCLAVYPGIWQSCVGIFIFRRMRVGFLTGPKYLLQRVNMHMQASVLHTGGMAQVELQTRCNWDVPRIVKKSAPSYWSSPDQNWSEFCHSVPVPWRLTCNFCLIWVGHPPPLTTPPKKNAHRFGLFVKDMICSVHSTVNDV